MSDTAKYFKLVNNEYHIYNKNGKEVGWFEPGDGRYGNVGKQTSIIKGLEDKSEKLKVKPKERKKPVKVNEIFNQKEESNDKKSIEEVVSIVLPNLVKSKKKKKKKRIKKNDPRGGSAADPTKRIKLASPFINENATAIEKAIAEEEAKIKKD